MTPLTKAQKIEILQKVLHALKSYPDNRLGICELIAVELNSMAIGKSSSHRYDLDEVHSIFSELREFKPDKTPIESAWWPRADRGIRVIVVNKYISLLTMMKDDDDDKKYKLVEPPEGWEIDESRSTFSKIVFKRIKPPLPSSFEELKTVSGYFVSTIGRIEECVQGAANTNNSNVFPSMELAEASRALAMLLQLRKVYIDGWQVDWTRPHGTIAIVAVAGRFEIISTIYNHPLSFPNTALAIEFKNKPEINKLLETAKPLL